MVVLELFLAGDIQYRWHPVSGTCMEVQPGISTPSVDGYMILHI